MRAEENAVIVSRFFEAVDLLIQNKVIRGLKTITDLYGLNRWNVNSLRKEPTKGHFQIAWLFFLYRDFKFSPLWLIAGEGSPLLTGWTFGDVKDLVAARAKTVQSKKNDDVKG